MLAVTADLRRRFGLRHLELTTEMTITDDRIALIELAEKEADGDLVLETNDEWAVARRYMSLETLARVTDNHNVRLPAVAT
ncbi:hypothetical protein E4L95_14945 [Paracoccus liaowanqingii]|uniref:Uncharacterized protein n=1 Tax=Paracoccus liaowanqingii TaxID=2560053 RepID=A0A4Z1CKX5_9RHOB|nr:hypothetical protein [Paracoccus liaowanqingii]TGN55582.1 hypothetical protein E4L95_14945 [Paracoccus liaowanqingii]